MKFNSFLVTTKHQEANFTGNLQLGDLSIFGVFKNVHDQIYTLHFKSQVKLHYLEKIKLKKRESDIVVLLPMLSKYNKRKLQKLAKLLADDRGEDQLGMLNNLLTIEKFLQIDNLIEFFELEKRATLENLIKQELAKKIKIIDLYTLTVTSYSNFLEYSQELVTLLTSYYRNQRKSVKLSEIETKLKLSHSPIFFRYLMNFHNEDFSYEIFKDKIIFNKISLSEKEKLLIKMVEEVISKKRLSVFKIEDILAMSDLKYKEVNDSLWYLLDSEKIIQLNDRCFIFSEELTKIVNRLKKYKRNQSELINIRSFKEFTSLSRENIIVLLEYFDSIKVTVRIGNDRKILLEV